jgi:hypothetical protein
MKNIERIKELMNEATPGPWSSGSIEILNWWDIWGADGHEHILDNCSKDDAKLIIEMRNVLPSLIQEHEALLRFVESVKSALGKKDAGYFSMGETISKDEQLDLIADALVNYERQQTKD